MNNKSGFTLIELIVVIIIVGILAVAGIDVYRSYIKQGEATEGKALLAEIDAAEQIYFTRNGDFLRVTLTGYSNKLGVDSRKNKYFKNWSVTTGTDNGFKYFQAVTTSAEGHTLTIRGDNNPNPSENENRGEDRIDDNTDYV